MTRYAIYDEEEQVGLVVEQSEEQDEKMFEETEDYIQWLLEHGKVVTSFGCVLVNIGEGDNYKKLMDLYKQHLGE